MRTVTALALTSILVLVSLTPGWADDSDIFGANIQPNIMLLLDSSGSMGDSIVSHPYDPATTYAIVNECGSDDDDPCNTPVVYRRSSGEYRLYRDTIAQVPSSDARTALSTVGFWSGYISGSRVNLYAGNYLNYQLGFCPLATCSEQKMVIAKRALKNLLDNVNGVRFGVMKFGGNSFPGFGGGQMVAEIGTSVPSMKNAVDAIVPSGYTPLGEFLYDGGQYYKGLTLRNGTSFASPIQLECQPSFIILISDGLQNGTMDVRQEASLRVTQDHAGAFTGLQNVIVHTVGFGITDQNERDAANAVLEQAATNGGGSFYYANDASELEAALQDAIRQIVAATFTFATPVLPTTSTTGNTRAYLAAFQSDPSSPFWRGFLKAYQRDANGQVPVDGNGVPLASALVWEAGQNLNAKAATSRTIYTAVSGSRQDFVTTNATITEAMLDAASPAERTQIIEFTRGIDAYDLDVDGNTTEERAWKLGDIFHSTPVLVTPPLLALNDPTYTAFKNNNVNRTVVLIAGSNDGMLHAFRESDGEELWAFIPPDLLGRLKELTVRSAEHPFFVDSSPIAVDIKVSGAWKTIVVFGLRRGGQHYYALDITDTTNPSLLWSFTDPKIGETWSEPAVGRVKLGGVEKFVAFVGGGYDTAQNNNTGKAFFVIDLATGAIVWEYWNNSSADDRQYMNFSLAANPTAADLNNDGLVDKVYIGDVGGQLWKFDVGPDSTADWKGQRLFAAAPAQVNPPVAGEFYPAQGIYGAPSLALDESLKLWVFFGTGDRNHPNNTAGNRFYGFEDLSNMTNGDPLTEADLVNAAAANVTAGDIAAAQGWYIPLASNEKVLTAANVFNKIVLFSTFTPTTTTTCDSGGGTAKLYAVQMETGFAAIDFNTGDALTTTNSTATRFVTIGTGIASMPVIVMTHSGATVSTSVVTATTSEQLPSRPVPPPPFLKRFLYWRELMGS